MKEKLKMPNKLEEPEVLEKPGNPDKLHDRLHTFLKFERRRKNVLPPYIQYFRSYPPLKNTRAHVCLLLLPIDEIIYDSCVIAMQ